MTVTKCLLPLMLFVALAQDCNSFEKHPDSLLKSYQATVTVDFSREKNTVSRFLYGNNTKWLLNGESNFGGDNGIWSIKNNCVNPHILKHLKESGITILRYGDGTNADFFYWGWSILPMEERIANNLSTRWGKNENYVFGLLEFIKLCHEIKCDANIIINYRMSLLASFYDPKKHADTRTELEIATQQATNLVEFLNAPVNKINLNSYPGKYRPEYSLQKMPEGYFAYLRSQMGYPEPINVKLWEIGNEINVFHESGPQASKEGLKILKPISVKEYIYNAIKFSGKMKDIDPTIKIGVVEFPSDIKEELEIAAKNRDAIDFLVAHDYIKGSKDGYTGTYAFRGSGERSGLSRTVTVKNGGEYILNVSAWGRAYFGSNYPAEYGVSPKLAVKVNGSPAGEMKIDKNIDFKKEHISRKSELHKLPIMLLPGNNTIDLRLENDFNDRSSVDIDRRGRDIFVDNINLTGQETDKDLLWQFPLEPIYSQLSSYSDTLKKRNALIAKYCPQIFTAQTESAVYPNSGELGAAVTEAYMLLLAMDNDIKIRNFWHLFGPCDRMASIHSGTREKSNYHITPQYLVIKLFSNFFGNRLVESTTDAPILLSKTVGMSDLRSDQTPSDIKIFSLKAQASKEDGRLRIALINLDPDQLADVQIDLRNFLPNKCSLHTISTESESATLATNEIINQNVRVKTLQLSPPFKKISLPPGSISIVEYQ